MTVEARPKRGITLRLEAGRHRWCACGRSPTLPLCAGTDPACAAEAVAFEVDEPCTRKLCACGHTANPPFCDGTHYRL